MGVKNMKRLIISALMGATAMLAQPVLAQSSTTTGDAAAQSNSNVSVVAITGPQGNSDINYSGHTWTTPNVNGGYMGGTNPCLVGTSVGAAGGPIGFNLNLGKNDEGCNRRSDAAAWHGMGFDNIAVSRMCQDQKNADAFFASTGMACPGTGASGRYVGRDGTAAREANLVSAAPALRPEERVGLDMRDPAIQRAIQEEARKLIRSSPQAAIDQIRGSAQSNIPSDATTTTPSDEDMARSSSAAARVVPVQK
jgi:hypothetical protein